MVFPVRDKRKSQIKRAEKSKNPFIFIPKKGNNKDVDFISKTTSAFPEVN